VPEDSKSAEASSEVEEKPIETLRSDKSQATIANFLKNGSSEKSGEAK
jgi:hypothetical protein